MKGVLSIVLLALAGPTFVVSHRLRLDDAPGAYDMFLKKENDCTKVVLRPM